MLEAISEQRTVEARGSEQRREKWIPDNPEEARAVGITDPDTLEAVDYYRTPRGYNKNSTNRRLFRGDVPVLGFDALHLVEEFLTQPIQVIVGGRLGATFSYDDGKRLWAKARNKKDFLVIDGAGEVLAPTGWATCRPPANVPPRPRTCPSVAATRTPAAVVPRGRARPGAAGRSAGWRRCTGCRCRTSARRPARRA